MKGNAMKIAIKAEDVSRRNPVAAELASGKFRNQVVRDRKKYTRKAKHKNRLTSVGF
jgi:stalled ribosome alternative rescue factor ArfA